MKEKLPYFHIESTLSNGQCFRWEKLHENTFFLKTAFDLVLLHQKEKEVILETTGNQDFSYWWKYFTFDLLMGEIQEELSSKDPLIRDAIETYRGMRLLRQDPFETTVSFITSQNNHIPRIKSLLNTLSTTYGKELSLEGLKGYAFPTPKDLINVTKEEYREMGFGYRDSYLLSAVNLIDKGQVNLEKIYHLEEKEAYEEIMKIKGVGRKVASCILLFAYGLWQAVPVDVWIKKVLSHWYGHLEGEEGMRKYFGDYAGIAQQYLFHYAREKKMDLVRSL